MIYDLLSFDTIFDDDMLLTYKYMPTKMKDNERKCAQKKFKGRVIFCSGFNP